MDSISKHDWNEKFDMFWGKVELPVGAGEVAHLESCPPHRVFSIDTDIGRKVDFKRLGPHHVVLPPRCRTSFPHAESHEEEFVFVLKGTPHLWLNGYLYELNEGHAVGFPAGTGIAHTFINNSPGEVQLLVVGEKTKKENKCVFPVNPELKDSCQIWWGGAPDQKLGPHLGVPGNTLPEDFLATPPSCLVYCPGEPRRTPFHYPGDNETFGEGFRISDKVGLKALGIWYERLSPGKRSAFPHAHSHEEEFIYVVKGNPTIWMDGFAKTMDVGAFIAFPSGTGINHVVINNTKEEVIYICVGEARDFPSEKITYPLNKLRKNECFRKGWYWADAPQVLFGEASAIPKAGILDHLQFELCDVSNVVEILNVYQSAKGYFERVDGCQPTMDMARKDLLDGPRQKSERYFKEFLLIKHNAQSIGCLDLHVNYPEDGVCYLALLILVDDFCGKGMGRRCYELSQDYIKRALACKKILLGVSEANDVSAFWMRMGFSRNGKQYLWNGANKTSKVLQYEKDLD